MTDTDKHVNAEMITLARESRGMTQTELAAVLGVSQAMLSKFEAGFKAPNDAMLARIGSALGYPESFFFQTDPVFGPGLSEFFHRRRQDTSVKVLARVHAQINIIRMHVARLLRAVELPVLKIRPIDMSDIAGGPSEVARAVRAAWQLPEGPIANVIRVIEDAGGIVIRYPFGTPKIDAISRWVPGLPPLFFVNEGLPTDRERLTLCHELGHLIMHDAPNGDMEREANQFAAEFLMPAREIAPHFTRVNLERLAAMKPYWRVSMGALLYRAAEMKRISKRSEQLLWMEMTAKGLRRREPTELDLAPETPALLQEIIDLYRDHFRYGIDELAQMLSALPLEVAKTYNIGQSRPEVRPTLRVVQNRQMA